MLTIPPNRFVAAYADDPYADAAFDEDYRKAWRACNQQLEDWADHYERRVLGFIETEGLVPFRRDNALWEPDGLHMSKAGYTAFGKRLAPLVADFVNAAAGTSSTAPTSWRLPVATLACCCCSTTALPTTIVVEPTSTAHEAEIMERT